MRFCRKMNLENISEEKGNMKSYLQMTAQELDLEYSSVKKEYEEIKKAGMKLDMSRGKPSKAQLDLSNELLNMPFDYMSEGVDCRNYGILDGMVECRRMFADILGVRLEQVFAGGSSSLTLMYDTIAKAYTHGMLHSEKPWAKLDKVKFLCPCPGYDRHFTISKSFGMELIPIPMTDEGPDMDMVEEYIKDADVKGIWCVPKYSNPDGIIYSDKVIDRLASMKPAAKDFILMWDNAYCVHEFDGEFVPFKNIFDECAKYGNEDMPFEFASTSKITLPGAGVACFAASEANMAYMKKLLGAQLISYDKVNQTRHVRFLKDRANVIEFMKKHAAIMKPKFDAVVNTLNERIAPLGIARWHNPKGGYFVSLYAMNGCAKRIHALCKEAGLIMTNAGATYPEGNDPNDSNLRIAPSFPTETELKSAMDVFCICLRLAALEKLTAR